MNRVLVIALLLSCAFAQNTAAPAAESAASFAVKDLQGNPHTLGELQGKVAVVNFWATWCGPCEDEMPLIVKTQKEYGDKIAVVALSVDDSSTQKNIPKFVHKKKMDSFPVWLTTPDDMKQLGVGPGVPATLFVDKDGKVIARIIGQLKKHDLAARLDWMLGDRTGPAPPALQDNMKN